MLTRTTSTIFFPPCSPSATCIRLPVYFLLIAWAKCPGDKMFSPKLNYSSSMSGYCRVDCLQSAFSLKIRLVLDLIQRDCKPRCYYIGIETRRPRFSQQEASPLACLGFACSNFAKRKIRDCSQSNFALKMYYVQHCYSLFRSTFSSPVISSLGYNQTKVCKPRDNKRQFKVIDSLD